jgi:hypothetical protein
MKILDALVKEYLIEIKYADFKEDERFLFEDVPVPIRLYLEKFPEILSQIVEGDRKVVEEFQKLPKESLLRRVLEPIYPLALNNLLKYQKGGN